jgi:hypothetical protein
VLLGQFPARLDELEPDELQALPLEPPGNLPDQPPLHRVRLQQDQRLLHGSPRKGG